MLLSNTTFHLRSPISTSLGVGGTFDISNDFKQDEAINTEGQETSIVFRNKQQLERFIVTIAAGTATIVKRGIDKDGITEDAALRKNWGGLFYMGR